MNSPMAAPDRLIRHPAPARPYKEEAAGGEGAGLVHRRVRAGDGNGKEKADKDGDAEQEKGDARRYGLAVADREGFYPQMDIFLQVGPVVRDIPGADLPCEGPDKEKEHKRPGRLFHHGENAREGAYPHHGAGEQGLPVRYFKEGAIDDLQPDGGDQYEAA